MQIATLSPVDPALSYSAEVVSPDRLDALDWSQASLLLWQVPLPEGEFGHHLESFVRSGRPILFFPPDQVGTTSWGGFRWGHWESAEAEKPLQVQSWRGDSDLLQHTLSGVPLPVGELAYLPVLHDRRRGSSSGNALQRGGVAETGHAGAGSFLFLCHTAASWRVELAARRYRILRHAASCAGGWRRHAEQRAPTLGRHGRGTPGGDLAAAVGATRGDHFQRSILVCRRAFRPKSSGPR